MSYENAPATKLLGTSCVACGRPLVDAISVQAGMGPDCREKYGYTLDGASAEAQADVNARVHAIASAGKLAPEEVLGHLVMIRALGFTVLADKLEERLVSIEIEQLERASDGAELLAITAPFSETFGAELRTVPGRRWCQSTKRWLVPATKSARDAAWAAMRRCFPGALGKGGAAGFFVVKPIA